MMRPFSGFWEKLRRPIIALSPMDGVTDFACRRIMARHGRPDLLFTEFTPAEAIPHAPEKILTDFIFREIERPIVAQIYGHRPVDFYNAAHVVCELGFDGIDINMGCPSKSVVNKNCGAKLITAPTLAVEIIDSVRRGISDWANGQNLDDLKLPKRVIETVRRMNLARMGNEVPNEKIKIPYSVKTRIGYDEVAIDRWIETLLKQSPAAISIHGRTLKQMYRGEADWDVIAKAAAIAKGSGTLILGNGDIRSIPHAKELIQQTKVDGVLIGRHAIGNPWIFQSTEPTEVPYERRASVALEHAAFYAEGHDFRRVRKHLIGYLRHFPGANEIRQRALQANDLEQLAKIIL